MIGNLLPGLRLKTISASGLKNDSAAASSIGFRHLNAPPNEGPGSFRNHLKFNSSMHKFSFQVPIRIGPHGAFPAPKNCRYCGVVQLKRAERDREPEPAVFSRVCGMVEAVSICTTLMLLQPFWEFVHCWSCYSLTSICCLKTTKFRFINRHFYRFKYQYHDFRK
jgi:hypothetical protein